MSTESKRGPKVNVASKITPQEIRGVVYQSCLPADSFWKIPVKAGQRFTVDARIDASCDSRGWSCDNWATRSGPEGVAGYYVGGSLGYPNAPIGMLIGALNEFDCGNTLDEASARRIFTNKTLLVAKHYDSSSPLDGFLYLIFNDTWSYADNKGSVLVQLTLF